MIIDKYKFENTEEVICRFQITRGILVGGYIKDADDWNHLKREFGVTGILNVESEHDDTVLVTDMTAICHLPQSDDGNPRHIEHVRTAIKFAKEYEKSGVLYVHCQKGRVRSPAYVYAILRDRGASSRDAIETLQKEMGSYFFIGPRFEAYVESIEAATHMEYK